MKANLSFFLILTWGLTLVHSDEFFPIVPDDLETSLFARDPLVRNPCAMAFDAKGRLCVGMGPQYRNPRPDTPGDSVFILIDEDRDGKADRRKEFAGGFNAIQGLAWKGNDLWVANSPDLTIVRDLDGDDEADEYVRVYTDLGNLEHALHGLNWAPDGKLYMSKGNSKGLTQPPDRIAPKAFRQLWGVDVPGLPDFPKPVVFKKGEYRKNYHDPQDDWGREGGILRCGPNGENLEIVARGFRNPWDIAFDDCFTWLGTDNDQTMGDKIFSPFYGAHFGWGHPWSFDWKGEDHLPSVPPSGPLFEGSGTGIIFCGIGRYPEKYRGVFLINDWLRREVLIYQPTWNGAHLVPQKSRLDLLASAGGGRSMERSQGRQFDPVDIEIGPDEAIYISSWGREYGVKFEGGEMANSGRVYRIWPKAAPPIRWPHEKHSRPIAQWPVEELIADLGSHLPVWRANAQEEMIRRGAKGELKAVLARTPIRQQLETWAAWTLGRMDLDDANIDSLFARWAASKATSLNLRLQSIRIMAHRKKLPDLMGELLESPEPRIRFESILAIRQASARAWADKVMALAARENDRLVFYAAWGALRELMPESARRSLLSDQNPGVRRAALLSLLEDDALDAAALRVLTNDADAPAAALARRRLSGKAEVIIRGRPLPVNAATPPIRMPALKPQTNPVSVQDALSLMAKADAKRGRELFLGQQGAGCVACHRLEGVGNVFAPDLTDIGARADAEFVIRSIIDPNAVITEGFVTHTFTVEAGEVYSGILLEESGAALKLALANGETVTLPRRIIQKRETSRQSAMPSNYGEILHSQQVADITAFLRAPASLAETTRSAAPQHFEGKRGDGQFEIFFGGAPVASYLFKHPQLTRPAIINVRTASGIPVTREFPAPPEADHRWMHPGIAMSFGWLDGNDYWRFKAKVEHEAFLKEPDFDRDRLTWTVRNRYLSEDADKIVCLEESRYALSPDSGGFLLQIDSAFFNNQRDFHLGDQEESGLCVRVAEPFCVKGGSGAILNDRGERNESGTWGREFQWIDYSGVSGHKRAGMLIVPHAENARVCWSHSRDYGVLVANPFPRQPQGRREPYVKTWVRQGERYRLRFSVLIYEMAAGPIGGATH
jgi:putative membrane-bound dehydrogenase-like protein